MSCSGHCGQTPLGTAGLPASPERRPKLERALTRPRPGPDATRHPGPAALQRELPPDPAGLGACQRDARGPASGVLPAPAALVTWHTPRPLMPHPGAHRHLRAGTLALTAAPPRILHCSSERPHLKLCMSSIWRINTDDYYARMQSFNWQCS